MPNAKDLVASDTKQRLLVVGPAGSGKTTLMRSLPGKKFAFLFDPAAKPSLAGCDIDYEEFLPDALELDLSIKGFNKGSKNDSMPGMGGKKADPKVYMDWLMFFNSKPIEFYAGYDWLCFDSLSLLAMAIMDRNLFLNNRLGGTEEQSDYKIAGAKFVEIFRTINSLPCNIYCTGHINVYQDDKTNRIDYQINLPGRSRKQLPLLFSNIWEVRPTWEGEKKYVLLTRAEARGFQDIRTTFRGLPHVVDATVDFARETETGIGAILSGKAKAVVAKSTPGTVAAKPAAAAPTQQK